MLNLRLFPFIVSFTFVIGLLAPAAGTTIKAASFPLDSNDSEIEDAVNYLLDEQSSNGGIGGFAISAWVVMALAAADVNPADCRGSSGDSIVEYLENEADQIDSDNATDLERMILAVVAAGEDPEDFDNEDYVQDLKDLFEIEDETGDDWNQIGEPDVLNDDFWGVIALEAAGANYDDETIDFIYANQNSDGGWAWDVGGDSDVDDTAAAIMALMAAGEDEDDDPIVDALDYLADAQNDDGGFPQDEGDDSNAASDAWAIMAIMAAGGDPEDSDWEQDDGTPVDHLLSRQDSEGYFDPSESGTSNRIWVTAYAIPALLGLPYPVASTSSSGGSGDATIGYSPTHLYFVATEDGEPPLDQTITVWNDGDGSMDYDIDVDEDWLEVNDSSGSSSGEEDDIRVSVDPEGLSEGDYDATITISSTDADNSPRHIDVSLEVLAEEDDTYISVYPDEFEFTAEEGESDPDDQILELWNGGPGSMDFEVDSDADWLDVSPDDGSSDGDHVAIRLSVDISDLDADDYDATVTVSSDDADNSPVEIDVSLTVEGSSSQDEEPELDFSPGEFEFEAEEGGDDPDEQTLKIWNSGDGDLDWFVSDNADWLALDPDEGTSTGEKDSVDLLVDVLDLDAGEYSARITIGADGVSSERVYVTLVVDESEGDNGGGNSDSSTIIILNSSVAPFGGGTITPSMPMGSQGYSKGQTVQLTATASPGYAFTGWSGDAAGTDNPVSVVMSANRNVIAHFVRFDNAGIANISLTYASPDMASVSMLPYPVQSLPNPSGFKLLEAFIVDPQGSGEFTLRFDGVPEAESVGVFKAANGEWVQLPRAVTGGTSLEVTFPAQDPIVAIARTGSTFAFLDSVTGLFKGMDTTTLLVVGIAALVVIAVILLLVLIVRRRESY